MKKTILKERKSYEKPVVRKVKLDSDISLWLMSEGTIPDPPWVNETKSRPNPYKTDKA